MRTNHRWMTGLAMSACLVFPGLAFQIASRCSFTNARRASRCEASDCGADA